MGRVLPILFNGDMVRAILDDRKTVTRRAVKYKYDNTEMKIRTDKYGTRLIEIQKQTEGETHGRNPDGSTWKKLLGYIDKEPPCKKGDILYVRETFCFCPCWDCGLSTEDGSSLSCTESEVYDRVYNAKRAEWGCWCYKASCDVGEEPSVDTWHPSIHMPKEIARIWLRVTDVRVERLQDITNDQILKEGVKESAVDHYAAQMPGAGEEWVRAAHMAAWKDTWDDTIKESEIGKFGLGANPWVWVIEFERCGKSEPCILRGIEPAENNRPCIGYGDAWSDEPCEMCKGCASCNGNM